MIFFILCSLLNIEFNFTTGSFLNNKKATELRIFYEIPRNKLTYTKSKEEWLARFQISCSLVRDKKEIGEIWLIEDLLKDYEATIKKDSLKGDLKILVEPGKYKIKIYLQDLNSQRTGTQHSIFLLEDLRKNYPQQISTLQFTDKHKQKKLSFEIYNFSKEPFKLNYKVAQLKDSISFENQNFVNTVLLEIPLDSIGFGTKIITLKIGELQIQDSLHIEEPFWINTYEKRVKQLYYIAEHWEIDSLLNTPLEHRKDSWEKFWTEKSSTLGIQDAKEQYFIRVDYANKHFTGIQEGWKTDRGKVYIHIGEPDEVEKHPFEIDQKPYEVWHYYRKNFNFVFVDRLGFGNYELEHPRYWQGEIQFK